MIGYHTPNLTLEEQGYKIETIKLKKSKSETISAAKEKFRHNLDVIIKTVEWNAEHNIHFCRISSEIAPHISDPRLLKKKDVMNYKKISYDLYEFKDQIKKIADLGKKYKQRLTFHAPFYTILNSASNYIVTCSMRELWWHYQFLKIGRFPKTSTVTIHGGGIFGDKTRSTNLFIQNYKKLNLNCIVLENDEFNYNINDTMYIHSKTGVPLVFDYFHYLCYNINHQKNPEKYDKQLDLDCVLNYFKKNKTPQWKLHYSEQAPNKQLGSHSDYIKNIPDFLFIGDIMVEAKCKEKAILKFV